MSVAPRPPVSSRIRHLSLATLMAALLVVMLGLANLLTVQPPPQTILLGGLSIDVPDHWVEVAILESAASHERHLIDPRHPGLELRLRRIAVHVPVGPQIASRAILEQLLAGPSLRQIHEPATTRGLTRDGRTVRGVRYVMLLGETAAEGDPAAAPPALCFFQTLTITGRGYWVIQMNLPAAPPAELPAQLRQAASLFETIYRSSSFFLPEGAPTALP